jgi:hypothetical protein
MQQRVAIVGSMTERLGPRTSLRHDLPMGRCHTLRFAGRTRRVADVGRRVRRDVRHDRSLGRGVVRDLAHHHAGSDLDRHRQVCPTCKHGRGPALLDNAGQMSDGFAGVERYDNSAGSDHAHDGRDLDHRVGSEEHDNSGRLRGQTEMPRYVLRPPIELAVGTVLTAAPNRDRAGVALDDLVEALVNRLVHVGCDDTAGG